MISILIPTRDRVVHLNRCINSINDNCLDKNNVEIILGVDNDDSNTIEYVKKLKISNVRCIFFDRLFYKNFHTYMNILSKNAKGELLWLLSDDCEIISKDWDKFLINYQDDFCYINVNVIGYENWKFSVVPIIHKKWLDITGRISNNSQTDLWLGHIAEELNFVTKLRDISINIFLPANGNQHNSRDFYTIHKPEWEKDRDKIRKYLGK